MGNEQGSTLYRLPLESPCKLSWTKRNTDPVAGREGHSSAVVNNKVYFFGGSGLTELFELCVFDLEDGKWCDIRCSEGPGPLCNTSLNAIGTKLYLFGGLNRETGWNNNIWSFDTDTGKWTKLSVKGVAPSPRDKHSVVVFKSKLVLFGGFGPAPYDDDDSEDEGDTASFTWYNDVFIFDTVTSTWSSPSISLICGPVARAAHTAMVYKNNMFIFGGKDTKCRNQDLFKLDLESFEWSRVVDAGQLPHPCSFHSTVQYKEFMLVFGGRYNDNTHSSMLHVLDCESGGWYDPIDTSVNVSPSPRGQSTLSLLTNGTLVMFGGSDQFNEMEQCCNILDSAVYTLDCSQLKPMEIPPPIEVEEEKEEIEPPPAADHRELAA